MENSDTLLEMNSVTETFHIAITPANSADASSKTSKLESTPLSQSEDFNVVSSLPFHQKALINDFIPKFTTMFFNTCDVVFNTLGSLKD